MQQNTRLRGPDGARRVARGGGYDKVNWQAVARALQGRVSNEEWQDILQKYTKKIAGARTIGPLKEED